VVRYHCQHQVQVRRNSTRLDSLELWLPVPINWPEQTISALKISPQVTPVVAANSSAQVAKIIIADPRQLAAEEIRFQVSYDLQRRETGSRRPDLIQEKWQPYHLDSKEVRDSLAPETLVQSQAAEIVQVATKIRGSQRPPGQVALDLYEWVLERTRYQFVEGFKGAEYCLREQHGECGDYSALFVALCRAAGIPARGCVGYWAKGVNQYHVWAEFLMPSGEWIPVDTSIGDQNEKSRNYYFGGLDNNRITMMKSFDLELPQQLTGHASLDFFQTGACWYRGTGGTPSIEFTFTGETAG